MDPHANIARQRELADEIMLYRDQPLSTTVTDYVAGLADDLAELVQALDEWRSKGGFDPYLPGANEPKPPEPDGDCEVCAVENGGVTRCTNCGSTTFRYEESHPSVRTMAVNRNRVVVFHGDFEWFDGDDTPGVVCQGCERHVALPESVRMDYSC